MLYTSVNIIVNISHILNTGQQFVTRQDISVSNGLTFGMDKQYFEEVEPSGIIRTWIGVDTSSARSDVTHELSLKV